MPEKTILVADDEPFIRNILKQTLKDSYKVITAEDGVETLEKVESKKPDLIILDVDMPGMNGYEVCQNLKTNSKHRNIPIIMLTVKAKIGEAESGFSAGADAYVPKPFSLPRLKEKIKKFLGE